MRLAYLDESGRSREEPVIVVAGVLIDPDYAYRGIEEALRQLVADTIPKEDREGFVFHASHLLHGKGYYKQHGWPLEQRWPILERLAKLPSDYAIPIVFGHLNKAEYRAEVKDQIAEHRPSEQGHVSDIAEHMVAFSRAEIGIERQMHRFRRDEVCMVIAEDTDRVKRALKIAHGLLRDPVQVAESEFAGIDELPLERIIDTPHFALKSEAPMLQLADLCAFLIMRRIMRQERSQPLFELIARQLVWTCTDFGEPMRIEEFGDGFIC